MYIHNRTFAHSGLEFKITHFYTFLYE